MLPTHQNTVSNSKSSGKGIHPEPYRHIFGPVPSRRLGLSLGVDLVPHKTCSLDCVYCECGQTTHLTLTPDAYVPLDAVKEELTAFLSTSPDLDFITFSGSGEPTLHSGIGEMAGFIKENFPAYRLALLTNGTLLGREDVRTKLLAIDVVIVSVDGGSTEAFQRINRPHPGLSLGDMEAGLVSFRKIFTNSLWVEVFLVPGCNTSREELARIRGMLERVHPDKVQVNTLDRPGAEGWVVPMDKEELGEAASFLQDAELISSVKGRRFPGEGDDLADRILAVVQRRPMTLEDISRMLGIDMSEASRQVQKMVREKIVKSIEMPRGIFYMVDPG
jgi:wyosine [tRNA(Phe)-imidazoG37] synthetase (radical SAM superfamily)